MKRQKGEFKYITLINVYTAIYKLSKYMKKSTGLKGKKDNFTIIVNNINTPLSTIYRLTDKYLIKKQMI